MLLKSLLIAFLTIACTGAVAGDRFFDDGRDRLTLNSASCGNPVIIRRLKPELRSQAFRKAVGIIGWREMAACWLPSTDGRDILVVYEDGDLHTIATAKFRPYD